MGGVIARAYNQFKIDSERGLITKSSNNQRIRDEINYYKSLPKEVAYFFPRLIDSTVTEDESSMTLELYGYHNLGHFLTGKESCNWEKVFSQLSSILSTWRDIPLGNADPNFARQMYVEKTESEYKNFVRMYEVDLFSPKSLTINGSVYRNFEVCWPEVKAYIEKELLEYRSSFMHGDCCFSNILYSPSANVFRFIDPRGSFGVPGCAGDIRYDVAKLYHSCDGGYEFFITDTFSVKKRDSSSYELLMPESKRKVEAVFEKTFGESFSLKEVKTIQGLIYIGMAARHYDSDTRQMGMYLTGVRILNEALSL